MHTTHTHTEAILNRNVLLKTGKENHDKKAQGKPAVHEQQRRRKRLGADGVVQHVRRNVGQCNIEEQARGKREDPLLCLICR